MYIALTLNFSAVDRLLCLSARSSGACDASDDDLSASISPFDLPSALAARRLRCGLPAAPADHLNVSGTPMKRALDAPASASSIAAAACAALGAVVAAATGADAAFCGAGAAAAAWVAKRPLRSASASAEPL